jgi:hypothetical protein
MPLVISLLNLCFGILFLVVYGLRFWILKVSINLMFLVVIISYLLNGPNTTLGDFVIHISRGWVDFCMLLL